MRLVLVLSALAAAACSDPYRGCTRVLAPGPDPTRNHDALQGAVGDASAGAVLCLHPGRYPLVDELTITTPGLWFRAPEGGAVLDFAGQQRGANGVQVASADGTHISGVTIKNTAGDALRVSRSQGITVDHVTVTWDAGPVSTNGGYGIYPVESSDVIIDHCTVSGASDTGIYVGQSRRVRVQASEAFGNVAGIEIENTSDAEVVDNYVHDNTGGVLVFNLPNLPVKNGQRALVHENRILHNNQANFAPAGNIVGLVPAGTGVLVLASSHNEIADNTVSGNDSTGLAVLSYTTTLRIDLAADPAYDPTPKGNQVHDNRFADNGGSPHDFAQVLLGLVKQKTGATITRVPDMVWDGSMPATGDGRNCFRSNGAATFRNLDADNDFAHSSTDLAAVSCSAPPLTPVVIMPALPRAAATAQPPAPRERLSEYGFFVGPLAELKPRAGVVPYDVQAPLYADGAEKARFMVLPPAQRIGYDTAGSWRFPEGTVLVKNFFFPRDERDPARGVQRIETRLLVLASGHWRGYTYLWNEAQTDAVRLTPGRSVHVSRIGAQGQAIELDYRVPSTDQCKNCHAQDKEAEPLGPRTRQLNRMIDYGHGPENQLAHLAGLGVFDGAPALFDAAARLADPRVDGSDDARARAYLEANCSHCHNPSGAASSTGLDLRGGSAAAISLGVCRPPVAAGPGSGNRLYDVVPAHPERSVMSFRVHSSEPGVKMPELPTVTADEAGAALIDRWILGIVGPTCL
jgi:parallel beta-helix repeat protein